MDYRSLVNKLEELDKPVVESTVIESAPEVTPIIENIVKEETSGIARDLIESFGYEYISEAPEYTTPGGIVIPSGAKTAEPAKAAPFSGGDPKSTSLSSRAWKGIKKLGSKAALPLAAATEIYDGYQKITALPKDISEQQYRSEVSKIVTKLVAHFGIFWVGMVIGGIIGGSIGTVGGPVAIVSGFAGALAGGIGLEWITGGTADKLIDLIVNKLYHTNNISKTKQAAQPATTNTNPTATTKPAEPTAAVDNRTDLEKYYDNLGK